MKVSFPAQTVAIQTEQNVIDPVWYDRIKATERFVNSGTIGQGTLATNATTITKKSVVMINVGSTNTSNGTTK